MKKIISVIMAAVMLCALTVSVFAEEVLYSRDCEGFASGNWSDFGEFPKEFVESMKTEGAVLVVTRSTETANKSYAAGEYEKFILIDGSWTGDTISLGTRSTMSADEPDSNIIDPISDDGTVASWDANAVYERWIANGLDKGGNPHLICNANGEGLYEVTNVSVIIPDAEEEPAEETPAEEAPADVEEAPAAEEEAPAETGIALALLPMALAAAAFAASKKK